MKRLQQYFLILICVLMPSFASAWQMAVPDTPVVLGPAATNWASAGFLGRGVARDSRSWVYVVFLNGSGMRVRCSRSTDNGRTWVVLADVSPVAGGYPNIAIGRGDTVHVVWMKQYVDTIPSDIFWSQYDGSSWSPPLNISNQRHPQNDMFCSLALDTLGRPHVVWNKGGNMWYSFYDGMSWSAPELATSPAWYLSLASDRRNRLHLIHNLPSYYLCRENGVWGAPELYAPQTTGSPSIAVDVRDRPQACWVMSSDSGGDIFYGYRDSTGWSTPVRLGFTRGGSRYPSLSEDRWGRHYVVWCDWPDDRDSLLYYGNLWWGRYDGLQWRVDSLRYDTLVMDWPSSVGFPVSDSGVDVVWTQGPRFGPYRVMYWRLPLLPSGVEGGEQSFHFTSQNTYLLPPRPNPATGRVTLRYHLPGPAEVSLGVYNVLGQCVQRLVSGRLMGGFYSEVWVGRDESDRPVGSGVFFVRLQVGEVCALRKVVLTR